MESCDDVNHGNGNGEGGNGSGSGNVNGDNDGSSGADGNGVMNRRGQWDIAMVIKYIYRFFLLHRINPRDHCISVIHPCSWTHDAANRSSLLQWFFEVTHTHMYDILMCMMCDV
jgi:hypothetical protein